MKKTVKQALKNRFSILLLRWNREQNDRQMPWKGEKDPYKIWLSEVILQQTRVEQGWSYYHRFIQTFPDIHHLAKAADKKIFKLWEGLGYYTRCRNLIATARLISGDLEGKFPDTYVGIKSLKGIGPYTAAAIASFAFNLPYAVVDGNVLRVLSRIFGIDMPVDSTKGRLFFTGLANELLNKKRPGLFNQAIMDFGAVVCKPAKPLCGQCVFKKDCTAFRDNRVNELPVKDKKTLIRKRWFYYLVPEYQQEIALCHRTEKDIWRDLYEFPMIEAKKEWKQKDILKNAEKNGLLLKGNYEVMAISSRFRQQLSHQLIAGQFIQLKLKKKPVSKKNWLWVAKKKIPQYAFPKFIHLYLQEASRARA